MEWRGISNQYEGEIKRFVLSVTIKRYWKDGRLKSLEEILEEYRLARRKKRDQMWFLYIDLRRDFDEIERDHSGLDCPFQNFY